MGLKDQGFKERAIMDYPKENKQGDFPNEYQKIQAKNQ